MKSNEYISSVMRSYSFHISVPPCWRHRMETYSKWSGALMFSFTCAWINGWVNNHEAGDLRWYCAHYDVTVMSQDSAASLVIWPYTHIAINTNGYHTMKTGIFLWSHIYRYLPKFSHLFFFSNIPFCIKYFALSYLIDTVWNLLDITYIRISQSKLDYLAI